MKRLILSAGLIASFSICNANAVPTEPAATHEIHLSAQVDQYCGLGQLSPPTGTGFDVNTSGSTNFNVLIDGLKTKLTRGMLTFPDASCNAPSSLKITRNGLKNVLITNPGDFNIEIPYSLSVSWGAMVNYNLPAGVTPAPQPVGPIIGELSLELTVDDGIGPLAKGSYQDTITMTITPDV